MLKLQASVSQFHLIHFGKYSTDTLSDIIHSISKDDFIKWYWYRDLEMRTSQPNLQGVKIRMEGAGR